MGITLFGSLIVRGHKFEGLTAEGEQIVRKAERILADHAALLHEAASLRSGVTGTVRLGVIPTAAATAAELTAPLCVHHPLVAVPLAEDLASSDITTRIDRGKLDGGITYLDGSITYLDDDVTSCHRTFPLYREHNALLTADDTMLSPTHRHFLAKGIHFADVHIAFDHAGQTHPRRTLRRRRIFSHRTN